MIFSFTPCFPVDVHTKAPLSPWRDLPAGHTEFRQGYNTAFATGEKSGVVVVDFDDIEAYAAHANKFPPTYAVATGRGVHLYFKWPGHAVPNRKGIWPKVDLRGDGGYVVAAGSVHANGRMYECLQDLPLADLPALPNAEPTAPAVSAVALSKDDPRYYDRYGAGVAKALSMSPSIEGEGGDNALWLICCQLVRTQELALDDAFDILSKFFNPRCQPPWPPERLAYKLQQAAKCGTGPTGAPSPDFPGNLAPKAPALGARRTHNPSHRYSSVTGAAQNGSVAKASYAEVVNILTHDEAWAGVLQLEEFSQKVIAVNPPIPLEAETAQGFQDVDTSRIVAWFATDAHLAVTKVAVQDAVVQVAHLYKYHAVRDYLNGLPSPTDPNILTTLASKALGTDDPIAQEFLMRFLVGAVRRITQPGIKFDTMLVLQGKQGSKKSSFIAELFGQAWTRESLPDLSNKDAMSALAGNWAIEMGEMDRILSRMESTTSKDFLSRREDKFRPSYGHFDVTRPRQCVFIGTTNEDDFLRDATGNRRYWPIAITRDIDLAYVRAHRDEIWAAARDLAKTDFAHWIDDDARVEHVRAPYVETDLWEDDIRDYCAGREKVRTMAIALSLGLDRAHVTSREQRRIARILQRFGCKHVHTRTGDIWVIPKDVQAETPSAEQSLKRAAEKMRTN